MVVVNGLLGWEGRNVGFETKERLSRDKGDRCHRQITS